MIFLSQLIRLTPANIRRNSRSVLLFSGSTWLEKDERGPHKVYRAKAKTTRGAKHKRSGNTHDLVIKLYGTRRKDGAMKPQNRSWVHCSCEYFLYYNEVALAARGSSEVMTSNGALPKIRNPRMKPYLCKHLLAASRVMPKSKAKARDIEDLDEAELDHMLQILTPYIPGAPARQPSRLGKRTRTLPSTQGKRLPRILGSRS